MEQTPPRDEARWLVLEDDCQRLESQLTQAHTFRPRVRTKNPLPDFALRNSQWLQNKQKKLSERVTQCQRKRAQDQLKECVFQPILSTSRLKPLHQSDSERSLAEVKGVGLHLHRQQKARSYRQVQQYKSKHPNWYVWNHRPNQSISRADELVLGRAVPRPQTEHYH